MATFSSDFVFGVATSAYQIEGAVHEDGRGLSIWDTFSHTPGKTKNGETGDIACDHYHKYEEDIAHMKEMGIQSYRFSIAWPRIFPKGYGKVNEAGLDFYRRLVEELLKQGITPTATLYHWDLPQALQDRGGWLNRDTSAAFGEYADTIFHRMGQEIPRFITLNEPFCSAALGHAVGIHAPGLKDYGAAVAASHHLLLGHGLAVQAYRQSGVKGTIGITNILEHVEPASDSAENIAATAVADALSNRWFLDPLFTSRYPDELRAFGIDTMVQGNDLKYISQPLDFLGVNYYFHNYVKANPQDPLGFEKIAPEGPKTGMGWCNSPAGLREVLLRVNKDYGNIPMYVTENGAAFDDVLDGDAVHDANRTDYIRRHLLAVHEAITAGADVRGYFVWSLMDNFEWQEGYDKRFGLLYVDYSTQRRIWKDSAKWYRDVAHTHTVVPVE